MQVGVCSGALFCMERNLKLGLKLVTGMLIRCNFLGTYLCMHVMRLIVAEYI